MILKTKTALFIRPVRCFLYFLFYLYNTKSRPLVKAFKENKQRNSADYFLHKNILAQIQKKARAKKEKRRCKSSAVKNY